ncbi:MAG: hypothetical protein U0599_09540 [Vicinamibacteria bacterium]
MKQNDLTEERSEPSPERLVSELERLWAEGHGDSDGQRILREELHQRPARPRQ